MSKLRIEMVDVEGHLLREIADKRMTRNDIALTYAIGLRQADDVDWAKVNEAIIERWSLSALAWIKDKAWRQLRARS